MPTQFWPRNAIKIITMTLIKWKILIWKKYKRHYSCSETKLSDQISSKSWQNHISFETEEMQMNNLIWGATVAALNRFHLRILGICNECWLFSSIIDFSVLFFVFTSANDVKKGRQSNKKWILDKKNGRSMASFSFLMKKVLITPWHDSTECCQWQLFCIVLYENESGEKWYDAKYDNFSTWHSFPLNLLTYFWWKPSNIIINIRPLNN